MYSVTTYFTETSGKKKKEIYVLINFEIKDDVLTLLSILKMKDETVDKDHLFTNTFWEPAPDLEDWANIWIQTHKEKILQNTKTKKLLQTNTLINVKNIEDLLDTVKFAAFFTLMAIVTHGTAIIILVPLWFLHNKLSIMRNTIQARKKDV